MASCIERRTQWWKLMQEHDPSVAISEEIRGDQLLENSGLNGDQKNLIMVSTGNSTNFDSVKEALIAQHGVTHVKSHNYNAPQHHRNWHRGGKGNRAGYIADSYDSYQDFDDDWYHDHDDMTSYDEAYTADTDLYGGSEDYNDWPMEDEWDQDYAYDEEPDYAPDISAFVAQAAETDDYDWEDPDTANEMAYTLHFSCTIQRQEKGQRKEVWT